MQESQFRLHDIANSVEIKSDFKIRKNGNLWHITIESRGGTKGSSNERNPEYALGLETLLIRLKDEEVVIEDAFLDTSRVKEKPREERRAPLSFPIILGGHTDISYLMTNLRSFQGNNQTRRLTLEISLQNAVSFNQFLSKLTQNRTEEALTIRNFFDELIEKYDYRKDIESTGQRHLKRAEEHFKHVTPLNLEISWGGGKGIVTHTPWVGFLDPEETNSPLRGIYLVYLLSKEKDYLNLSVGQGITDVEKKYGRGNSSQTILKEDAIRLRAKLEEKNLKIPNQPMQLQSNGTRQKAYIAGSISSIVYDCNNLPSETDLVNDLQGMFRIYQHSIQAKRELLLTSPGEIRSPSPPNKQLNAILQMDFKPKNSDEYRALIKSQVQIKRRDHEKLVKWFGEYAQSIGYEASTPHPQDLVLKKIPKFF